MKVKELITWFKLRADSGSKVLKIQVEGYGITEHDFTVIFGKDIIISIAKPTEKDYQEGVWIKDANL